MKPIIFIFVLSLLAYQHSFSQQGSKIDSLNKALIATDIDTVKVKILNRLTSAYFKINMDSALYFVSTAYNLAKRIHYSRGLVSSYSKYAQALINTGRNEEAIKIGKEGIAYIDDLLNRPGNAAELKVFNEIKSALLQNLGASYDYLSIYPEALKYYTECLQLKETLGDLKGSASTYHNIGGIYLDNKKYDEALSYFQQAYAINKDLGNKDWLSNNLVNIAIVFGYKGQHTSALTKFKEAVILFDEQQDNAGKLSAYISMAELYEQMGMKDSAVLYLDRSLKLNENVNNPRFTASAYLLLGRMHTDNKDYRKARNYLNKADSVVHDLGDFGNLKEYYRATFSLDSAQGNMVNAIRNLQLAYMYHDSMHNEDNVRKLTQTQMNYDFEKKEAASKAEQEKKDALEKEAFQHQQDSLKLENSKRELSLQKEMELKALTFEYERKQALAKSEKERQQLKYEEELKRKEIENNYAQKQLQAESEYKRKQAALKAEQEKKDAVAKEELRRQKLMRNVFVGGFLAMLLFAGIFFRQRNKIKAGKKQSDELLLNILPAEVAEELKQKGSAETQLLDEVTVLFTDFKGFTQLSEKLTPKELVDEINECFSAFDHIMQQYGVEKIKTIGDAYMAAGGLPSPNDTHAMDVVNAAMAIQQFMIEHKQKKEAEGKLYFEIRIGIHTGPVVAGIVGVKKFAYDIWGDTVNTASRMESSGEAGKVNISGATYDLVKHQFKCVHRGKVTAKGKGEIDMYFVENLNS